MSEDIVNEHCDLFEYYEKQPIELEQVVAKYANKLEDGMSYDEITEFHNAVYEIGYTFDSGLDAQPYGLRPIGIELNQLKGWEEE
jgi:hypothetical protein